MARRWAPAKAEARLPGVGRTGYPESLKIGNRRPRGRQVTKGLACNWNLPRDSRGLWSGEETWPRQDAVVQDQEQRQEPTRWPGPQRAPGLQFETPDGDEMGEKRCLSDSGRGLTLEKPCCKCPSVCPRSLHSPVTPRPRRWTCMQAPSSSSSLCTWTSTCRWSGSWPSQLCTPSQVGPSTRWCQESGQRLLVFQCAETMCALDLPPWPQI